MNEELLYFLPKPASAGWVVKRLLFPLVPASPLRGEGECTFLPGVEAGQEPSLTLPRAPELPTRTA